MHLAHQRAGGIEDAKASPLGFALHGLGHAVGAEDERGAGWHVVQLFDEDGALGFQVIDHVGVVHDFVAHIDGRAEFGQRALHDFNGPVHARAKAARRGQQHFGILALRVFNAVFNAACNSACDAAGGVRRFSHSSPR